MVDFSTLVNMIIWGGSDLWPCDLAHLTFDHSTMTLELVNLVSAISQKLYIAGFSYLVKLIVWGNNCQWSCSFTHLTFDPAKDSGIELVILVGTISHKLLFAGFSILVNKVSLAVVVHSHVFKVLWPLTFRKWPWTYILLGLYLRNYTGRFFKFCKYDFACT